MAFMAFVMQNFLIWGLVGVGEKILLKPPEGTFLADFMRFEPLYMQITDFSLGKPTKEKGHYKKSQRGYISPIGGNSPLNQI